MSEFATRLVGLETDVLYQEPPRYDEQEFAYQRGEIPILLSASHGAAYLHHEEFKEEDEYTAAFARLIGEETGAHALYSRRQCNYDSNREAMTPYKSYLSGLVRERNIRLVLDLHGASALRLYGIALGTLRGRSSPDLRDVAIASLESHGFSRNGHGLQRLDADKSYPADEGYTITRFVWEELGIPAMQISINAHLRIVRRFKDTTRHQPFRGNPDLIERTARSLIDLVTTLEQAL